MIFPWAEDEAGDAAIEILNLPDGINVEKIAALRRPDLIMGVYSDIDAASYAKLAEIAPTVARPAEHIDYGTPGQVQTVMTGQALGKSAQARAMVTNLEERFAQVRRDHPEFAGLEAAVTTYAATGALGTFASDDPRARFFSLLGFGTPKEIDDLAKDVFYVEISREKA